MKKLLVFLTFAILALGTVTNISAESPSPSPTPPGIITSTDEACFNDLFPYFGSFYANCYCQYKCSIAEPSQLECMKLMVNRYKLSWYHALRHCGYCFLIKELDPTCP